MHEFVYEFAVDYQTLNILFIYLLIDAFIYFSFCLAAKSLLLFASKIYLNVWSLL